MAHVFLKHILVIFLIFKINYASERKESYFVSQQLYEIEEDLRFYRLSFEHGVSPVFCAFKCLERDACKSFYIDERACVLGVLNTSEFEGNEEIFPAENVTLKTKGTEYIFTLNLSKAIFD